MEICASLIHVQSPGVWVRVSVCCRGENKGLVSGVRDGTRDTLPARSREVLCRVYIDLDSSFVRLLRVMGWCSGFGGINVYTDYVAIM